MAMAAVPSDSARMECKTEKPDLYKVGDFCSVRYTENGQYYEAMVRKVEDDLDGSRKFVIVELTGYDGVKKSVWMDQIKPSKGDAVRNDQIRRCENYRKPPVSWKEGDPCLAWDPDSERLVEAVVRYVYYDPVAKSTMASILIKGTGEVETRRAYHLEKKEKTEKVNTERQLNGGGDNSDPCKGVDSFARLVKAIRLTHVTSLLTKHPEEIPRPLEDWIHFCRTCLQVFPTEGRLLEHRQELRGRYGHRD